MRRLLATLLLVVGLTACHPAPVVRDFPNRGQRCEEDEPCWDCETMGNRICGPVEP